LTQARAVQGGAALSFVFPDLFEFQKRTTAMSGILYIIFVGFVAGVIARFLSPGPNNPSGFLLTTALGIGGAFVATFIGQAIGHYGPNQGAGFITATIGALVVLFVWNRLEVRRRVPGPGTRWPN
jgi:uncharacterized membrane protein YeaQ/YmgE (transglycosylase-associated protein family)